MKRILIAVDYNPVSEKVVDGASALYENTHTEICLIHVLDDAAYYGTTYPTFLGYEGYTAMTPDLDLALEMRNIAEEFLDKAAEHLKQENVTTHLAEGDVPKALLKYAEDWNADVIVMGTHSHSTLEKLIMGTVAEKVLEKTNIPIYFVPVKE